VVVLVIVVTIKNESPVEMVLNSTCESSCFLVTKIFNKLVFLLSAIQDCSRTGSTRPSSPSNSVATDPMERSRPRI